MRVLFAPVEIGGNMRALAEELRRRGISATAATLLHESSIPFMDDIHFGPKKGERRACWWLRRFNFFLWAASNFDVFHFFYGQSLLPGGADLPILRALGKTLFMHFRGSDIRDTFGRCDPSVESGQWTSSPKQQRMIARYRRYCHRLLVSTPDLLDLVPDATWIPQVIRTSDYEFAPKVIDRRGPISVVHAVTVKKPGRDIYGTEVIEGAVAGLRARGYDITLKVVRGLPHSEAIRLFQTAHLGIGRMGLGWYGNFTIELMAMGIPVLIYIDERLRKRAPVPLLSVGASSLEETLERLLLDRKLYRQVAESCRKYVEQFHDVGAVTTRLLEMYQDLSGRKTGKSG